jgi:hypothetical protein
MSYRTIPALSGPTVQAPKPVAKPAVSIVLANPAPSDTTNNQYGSLAAQAINLVTKTGDVFNNLTSPAKQQTILLKTAFESVTGHPIEQIENQVKDEVMSQLMPYVKQFASMISDSFGPSLTNIGDAVPILGAIFSILVDAATPSMQAGGLPCHFGDIDRRAQGCRMLYRIPVGTGPNGAIMPCDIFAWGVDATSNDLPGKPPLVMKNGQAVVNVGDGADTDIGNAFIAIFEQWYGPGGFSPPYAPAATPPGYGTLIPAETQKVIRALRRAINASFLRGDGGASLWPIYLDICNYQVRAGRLTHDYMHSRMNWNAWWCSEMDEAETCFAHDKRGFLQMMSILDGWDKTVHSPYVQYVLPQLTEAQMIAKAKSLLPSTGPRVGGTAPKKPLSISSIKTSSILIKPKAKHPVLAAAGGAAAAGLLLWFFL